MPGDDEPTLRIFDLGKRYVLAPRLAQRDSARAGLERALARPLAALRAALRPEPPPELWALRHVSFEARAGETIGIIGPNGAGKSTLLKLLARITRPTEGRIEIRGRLSSMLEVGAGFHPELSGRDNILLYGVLLGMRRREVAARFDEIVAFAGIEEKFLDTSVKHYSSGMYTRLAFAVAARLDPDVLIVDEALAVGDADFQARCLAHMRSIAERGVTVLLVSHSMPAILDLCRRAILLERGTVVFDGPAADAVAAYRPRAARRHGSEPPQQ